MIKKMIEKSLEEINRDSQRIPLTVLIFFAINSVATIIVSGIMLFSQRHSFDFVFAILATFFTVSTLISIFLGYLIFQRIKP